MENEYFEDCKIGKTFITSKRTVTETDIVLFAAFTSDWNPVHTDVEFSKSSAFGERIAHGMLNLVVGTGLLFRHPGNPLIPKSIIAITGLDKIRFVAPVFINDTLCLKGEVVEMMPTSDDKGIITLKFRILNQRNKTVIRGRISMIAGRRPAG